MDDDYLNEMKSWLREHMPHLGTIKVHNESWNYDENGDWHIVVDGVDRTDELIASGAISIGPWEHS